MDKMAVTFTDIGSLLEEMERLDIQTGLTVPKDVELELGFLKMFISCLTKFQEASEDVNPVSMKATRAIAATNLDSVCSSLLEKAEFFKPRIRETCSNLLDSSIKFKSCSSDEILEFIGCLVGNLKDLLKLKGDDMVVPLKNQIIVLQGKLSFLANLIDFTAKRCSEHRRLEEFLDYVKDWVHRAACLLILSWVDGNDQVMGQRLETMLCNLLQKIKPYTPKAPEKFFGVLKSSKSSRSDKLLAGQIVVDMVDIFLEDLVDPLKDNAETLRESLIFTTTFLMDPSADVATNGGKTLLTQVDAVIEEVLSLLSSLYLNEFTVDTLVAREISFSSLQSKIEKAKAEVAEVYIQVPNSSELSFPMTNGMGFIEFFLDNLKKMLKHFPSSISFAKPQVGMVKKQLLLLQPYLKDIMEVQNEHEELKDLWKRVIKVVYQAQDAIASCSLVDHPIWYNMVCLSSVIEGMKLIETELKLNDLISKIRMTNVETSSSHLLPKQANTSRLEEVVIGLNDESKKLVDRLTRGTKKA